ncbi:MAG: 4-alpha-glucanotransferase [Bacteriovoracaceae bacterium]|nr:4-alpha-glucanotransferase [Bacteriovoracaceae bacterium]
MNGIDSKRRYGVLLHPTALPSNWGIGDIGISSRKLIDWLHASGAAVWQLLPTGVVDKWGCPYSSYSAFGGNPMLICIEDLVEKKLLTPNDISPKLPSQGQVNFKTSWNRKRNVLLKAFENFKKDKANEEQFNQFLLDEGHWVHDLSNFLVLTELHGDDWTNWPLGFKQRDVETLEKFESDHSEDITFQIFLQFLYEQQWLSMKNYAKKNDVELFGDIPIFVAHHSMDVWRHPEQFKLNAAGKMEIETGAPPDAFSDAGQKWGTPNYNWEKMRSLNFQWWVDRVQYLSNKFDLLRLDHFLGFVHIWESPKEDVDARNGGWSPTPGRKMFEVILEKLGKLPFVAEDLGELNDDVHKLRDDFELPGMKILQFAFGTDEANQHLPENTPEHFVVYTGTHDNNTLKGWYKERQVSMAEEELDSMFNLLSKYSNSTEIHEMFLETAMQNKNFLCVFPIQDIFGLDEESRFNTPGTTGDKNWTWIMPESLLTDSRADEMKKMANRSGRLK